MEPAALAAHLEQTQGVALDPASAQAYAALVAASCGAVREVARTAMRFEDEPSAFVALLAREETRS